MLPQDDRLSQISRWLPLFAWMALISMFSTDSFSNNNTGSIIEPVLRAVLGRSYTEELLDLLHHLIRKAAHVTEYAILCGLWYRAVNPGLRGWSRKAAIASSAFSIVYAALDEFHQAFTSEREGSPLDVMIDSAGVLVALTIIWFYNKRTGFDNEHK